MLQYIFHTLQWHLRCQSKFRLHLSPTLIQQVCFFKLNAEESAWVWTCILKFHPVYHIAGNFRLVLIFTISRTVYGVAKINTAIIYSNINSKVGSFEIAKIKIAKIISQTFTFKSRKFSSAKIPRYTVSIFLLLIINTIAGLCCDTALEPDFLVISSEDAL